MLNLLFIHGIAVRDEAWFRNFELISQKAKRFLPQVTVHGCQWGDAFGAHLQRGGITVPGYETTGNAADPLENSNRARWFLLADNPLLELRILPEEGFIGVKPGPKIFSYISGLATNHAVLDLLLEWSVADLWPVFIEGLAGDGEWKSVVESITASAPAASEKVARAITAAFQKYLRANVSPGLGGFERDRLKNALVNSLGGPPLGIGDWFLQRLTNFGIGRRGGLTDATTPGIGDLIRYQSRGAELRGFIWERIQETSASILLTHSLGGIAAVDLLASVEYAGSARPVKALITVGSQAPFLYEIDALVSRKYGSGLPDTFPSQWLNICDPSDFLSYLAEPAFPDRVRDVKADNGQPFPESHSAYWHNEEQVWKSIQTFLAGI